MTRTLFFLAISLFVLNTAYAQTCSNAYPSGAINWSALSWSCAGGGSAPSTAGTYTENLSIATISTGDNITININLTLNGNLTISSSGSNPTITIPAGVTVVINGDLTDNDNNVVFVVNGTLIVTGTMKAKNNTVFSGTGTVSGGTLDLGNGASCSGSCPGLSFTTCSAGSGFCTNVTTANTYTWDGSGGAVWTSQGNWTPTRTSPASSDILIFSASGANKTITSVPTQSVGRIFVTGSSTYDFQPASGASRTLTATQTSDIGLQIDNGSTLSIGTAGTSLGISMSPGSEAQIGGQLNLINGNFDVSNTTLTLHTNSAPLARTSGQVSANASTVLKFGDAGYTSGSNITLPNSIFVSAPTISSLVINRTNGATLGDQTITVAASTFTLGDLTTNSGGRIKFTSAASSPSESTSSKIIGFAEMALKNVGTGALNFLSFNMAAGSNDVGFVSLVRRTGTLGTNTFNSSQSIASSWDITTTGAEPAAGRSISFSWQSAFDNVTTASNTFQTYIFNSGPGWTALGSFQSLAAQGPPRQSAAVTTTKLNDTFTLTDNTQALPVELISFTATPGATSVTLKWETASEKNNDYFLVERMLSGELFTAIGQVAGAGTSLVKNTYSLIDEKPAQGLNYYRIKQVDFDGKSTYSDVIKADFTGKPNTDITIYPNPADKVLNFDNLNEDTYVSLTDSRGKVVFTTLVNASNPSVDLSEYHLTTGMYFVRILDSNKNQVKKVIIK